MKNRWPIQLCCLSLLLAASVHCPADTVIGDWGHFVSYKPKVFLANPDGRACVITVHAMQWVIPSWNPAAVKVRLTGPDGAVITDGDVALRDAEAVLRVPTGAKGTYLLETDRNIWVSSTLDHSVLWTGDCAPEVHAVEGRRAVFQASVPRNWWFWVPPGTTRFVCRAQRADRYMSQREDWGFFITTPRGQRIRALWGQPPHTSSRDYRRTQEVEVEVEPGAAGRFWCLEVRLGDSHNYSNINICFDGVPPYIARSPEEWFDPDTGAPPDVPLYDDTPFIQSARIEDVLAASWPNLQHFSPCPSLGDPDGIEILGDGHFAIWNPAGRRLGFRIGTYLPRAPEDTPDSASVRITGPTGTTVLDKQLPMHHIHHNNGHPADELETGDGVSRVAVTGVERWLSFTYPATPLVLLGRDAAAGWAEFRLSVGTARNWYFMVPTGTTEFAVRVAAAEPTDILHFQVCAPDRTLAVIYGNGGEQTVKVPPGLDGKIWHVRPDVGSASRLVTRATRPRFLDISMTLGLKGVPPCLAPTWEQWFDPERPVPPLARR